MDITVFLVVWTPFLPFVLNQYNHIQICRHQVWALSVCFKGLGVKGKASQTGWSEQRGVI